MIDKWHDLTLSRLPKKILSNISTLEHLNSLNLPIFAIWFSYQKSAKVVLSKHTMNDLHSAKASPESLSLCPDNIDNDDNTRGAQDQAEGPGDRQPAQHLPPGHGQVRERF